MYNNVQIIYLNTCIIYSFFMKYVNDFVAFCIVVVIVLILVSTCETHDDIIKWQHFPHYWPFLRGIHRSPVNSPHKGQWRGALKFSLICVWINGWVNNGDAGDLRRYRTHHDVTVMFTHICMILRTIMTKSKDILFCYWGLLSILSILQLNKINIDKASKPIKSCQLANLYVIHAYFVI